MSDLLVASVRLPSPPLPPRSEPEVEPIDPGSRSARPLADTVQNYVAPRFAIATLESTQTGNISAARGSKKPQMLISAVTFGGDAKDTERFEVYLSAYAAGAEVAVQALHRDGYADWVDTFGGTERVRPGDAADAALRVLAALHSVVADIRSGQLTPREMGAEQWGDVGASAILGVAKSRLLAGDFDFEGHIFNAKDYPAEERVVIERLRGLMPAGPLGVAGRSAVSLVAANWAAGKVLDSPIAIRIARGAQRVTNASAEDQIHARLEANLATSYALFNGAGLARNAQAVLPAVLELSGVSPLGSVKPVPPGSTPESLKQLIEAGRIDGVLETGQGLMTYRIKTPQEVAAAVNAKLLDGQLDHLSIDARVQLGVLLGPESAPGEQLAHRIEAEGRWSDYRQFASGVIDLAAVSIASGGAGGLIEGAAVGARLGATGIRAARFVAASASFTTLMGVKSGELSASGYAKDALMFGILAKAARLAPLVARSVPGSTLPAQLTKLGIVNGAAVGVSATVLTGAQAAERALDGGSAVDHISEDLVQHLAVVALLHATNLAVAKLHLRIAPGGPTQAELTRLRTNYKQTVVEVSRALDLADNARTRGDVRGVARGLKALGLARNRAQDARNALSVFAHQSVGAEAARELGFDPIDALPNRGRRRPVPMVVGERGYFIGKKIRADGRVSGRRFAGELRAAGLAQAEALGIKLVEGEAANRVLPEDAAAGFDWSSGTIYLRDGATYYEWFHEMAHARQWRALGPEAYEAQSRFEREAFVFSEITGNRQLFGRYEVEHAKNYIERLAQGTGQKVPFKRCVKPKQSR